MKMEEHTSCHSIESQMSVSMEHSEECELLEVLLDRENLVMLDMTTTITILFDHSAVHDFTRSASTHSI